MLEAETKTEQITKDDGMVIYNLIKSNPSLSPAQLINIDGNNYLYTSFKEVIDEKDRLFNEFSRYASGSVLLTPEEFHFDEETGEKVIDKKAVYYTLTTETDFKAQFNSDLLDVNEVYNDWKGSRTWTEIKSGEQQ